MTRYGKVVDSIHIGGYLMIPKCLSMAKLSPLARLLFVYMVDHYKYQAEQPHSKETRELIEGGWFYWTYPSIEENVGIKHKQAEKLIKELYTIMLIDRDTKRVGMEQRCWYRINEEKLEFYQHKYSQKRSIDRCKGDDGKVESTTRCSELDHTDRSNTPSNQDLSNQDLKEVRTNNYLGKPEKLASPDTVTTIKKEKAFTKTRERTIGEILILHFLKEFERTKGTSYVGNDRSRASGMFKRLQLKNMGIDDIKRYITYYLEQYKDSVYTFAHFDSALGNIKQLCDKSTPITKENIKSKLKPEYIEMMRIYQPDLLPDNLKGVK